MAEMEYEHARWGSRSRPGTTRWRPSSTRSRPIFETSNLATDHHLLVMEMLRQVAHRHGMACLLHEKPFAGINGIRQAQQLVDGRPTTGTNLLEPGRHAARQRAVPGVLRGRGAGGPQVREGLLRMGVGRGPANDHRLGANEAPPAIISVFLGEQLTDIFTQIEKGAAEPSKNGGAHRGGRVDAAQAAAATRGDRNRTSPFAFTGNKFEFRALGSMLMFPSWRSPP